MQRLDHWHDRHRGAVRVGNDALRQRLGVRRVDLGDDQGHLVILAPCRGVVHNLRAGCGKNRGPLARGGTACGEQRDVHVRHGLFGDLGQVFNLNGCAAELQHLARGTRRGEETNAVAWKGTVLQDGAHYLANLAGGANYSNGGHNVKTP